MTDPEQTTIPPADSPDSDDISPENLETLSHDDLVRLVMDLNQRVPKQTDLLEEDDMPPQVTGDTGPGRVKDFLRLPEGVADSLGMEGQTWKVILVSINPDYRPIGLELVREITVGRSAPGSVVDLDLSVFNAVKMGVSRRHVMLRPTPEKLYIIDLGSTNGSYYNEVQLMPGVAQELNDGDTIAFGRMLFTVSISSQPGQ